MTRRGEPTSDSSGNPASSARRWAAWGVHLFTASGVVCTLLAIEATYASQWRTALTWLVIAVIIDAVDGPLARWVGVRAVLPGFDGTLLDNLIDYANYVIVPALIIHRSDVLPDWSSLPTAAVICLASTYQFCQQDAKTSDHFFTGFPSYWNIVALYLLAMGLPPNVNLAIIAALVVAVFLPVKYIYVTRTRSWRRVTYPLTGVWAIVTSLVLWQLPNPSPLLVILSLAYVVYYVAISLHLTRRTRVQLE